MKNFKITAKELRNIWIDFYVKNGHKDCGSESLISDGSTGAMFNVAGMQPIMPYLLGKKHALGTRLVNIQGCIRTIDIEEVGDSSHLTYFEMMGNWSLNDYFKKEKTAWSLELLTKKMGYKKEEIHTTVFAGNKNAPKDTETEELLLSLGIKKENIHFIEGNWWQIAPDAVGTPCGPDNEWFYKNESITCPNPNCNPECECGKFVEIGNDVYMQYIINEDLTYKQSPLKNVDTGFGFERNLMFLNNVTDVYQTDLFYDVIKFLEGQTGITYLSDKEATKQFRIIADHARTAMMLLGDEALLKPSNVGAGYILRRIIRRAIRSIKKLGASFNLKDVAEVFMKNPYYAESAVVKNNKEIILKELEAEEAKFLKTLETGEKEFNKVSGFIKDGILNGKTAFRLYDTFGFPIEMTCEMAAEKNLKVDLAGYEEAKKNHILKSQTAAAGENKGGINQQEDKEKTTRLHTATHLLNAALRKVLGQHVFQKGSNITAERLRFDFSHNAKLTPEEVAQVENLINTWIGEKHKVEMQEMQIEEAKKSGAIGVFDSKYGDVVKVYSIGEISRELCGGPHVENISELGKFKIKKEEASSSGVRRIKAILQN